MADTFDEPSNPKINHNWLYIDSFGRIQGPLSRERLFSILTSGILAANVPVKRTQDKTFVPYLRLVATCESNPLETGNLSPMAKEILSSQSRPTSEQVYSNAIAALSKIEIFSHLSNKIPTHQPEIESAETTEKNAASQQMSAAEINKRKSTLGPIPTSSKSAVKLGRYICNCIHSTGNGEVCEMRFKSMKTLKQHQETTEKLRKFECKPCQFVCYRRDHLTCHMQRYHNPSFKYVCKHCGARTATERKLNWHLGKCRARALETPE